jgi:hypothetical protein
VYQCPNWLHVCVPCLPTGCFDDKSIPPELTRAQLFGWEVVMTFTLISVVYACGVAKPGHGSFTPLAVGLSLVACAGTGELEGVIVLCRTYAVLHLRLPCCLMDLNWRRSSPNTHADMHTPVAEQVAHVMCERAPGVGCLTSVPIAWPAGGKWTGAALNPARVIGPLAVFRCGTNVAWIYVLAQLLAAVLSCCIFSFVSGW